MLDLRHLHLIAAISDTGGVTAAAAKLHLTQSALSHQLRDAEGRLGTRLFDRVGRRMRLTPAGERLLRTARGILEDLDQAEQDVRRAGRVDTGPLRLTTQCHTVYHWLPGRLKIFRRSHPDVEVQIVAGATDEPLVWLLEGRIDLAIACRFERDPRLASRALWSDEMVVMMHPRHPLARRRWIEARDFADQHLFVYSRPLESNMVFREILIPAGVTPRRVSHIQLTEALIEMVKADLGVTVLQRWSAAPQLDRGELIARPLTARGKLRHWSAVWRRRPDPPAWLTAFVDTLARHPVPLGRTSAQRRRTPSAVVSPGS
ncbi:MAG: LysR family transcriptional regulator [Candidatus Polarisedimenticolia bacterium]